MKNTELNYLSATAALERFRARTLSPVELLDAVIGRAEEIAVSVNPFADRFFDAARKRARQAEGRYQKGNARRLEGLPLLVKDSCAIKGTRATVGSLMNAERVDTHSDPSVERLLLAVRLPFAPVGGYAQSLAA